MTVAEATPELAIKDRNDRAFLGHPKGLGYLGFTEACERFSYYSMQTLLVLYMVDYLLKPGQVEGVLGLEWLRSWHYPGLEGQPLSSAIFGDYSSLVYLMPIVGGIIADKLTGRRIALIAGALMMALGHFLMAFESAFLLALLCLIVGVGLFKGNIATQVGELYSESDLRRAMAFQIFYIFINVSVIAAPLISGTLGEEVGWHYGFAAAGIGMLVSLGIYLGGRGTLPPDTLPRRDATASEQAPLERGERRAMLALIGVCAPVALFWAAYDQQGNTLLLWAEDFTDRSVNLGFWQGEIPTPWFLALNPLMIFVFTPLIVRLWAVQGQRGTEPLPISKMAFGCLCVAFANLVMAAAAWTAAGKVSALWLAGYFLLATIGELHLAPIGLALISKAAPARALSVMMGVWFATTLPGDILAGFLGGFWSGMAKTSFFLMIALVAALASAGLCAAGLPFRKR